MFNTNWALNSTTPASNIDWSALADSWMQQREQQTQWQQVLPPAPPPPQFLLNAPPIPPPGLPPMGMTFPPLPPASIGLVPHHRHQLQVGSNTTQESLTMTNIENSPWRPPPHPLMMQSGPQWRPHMNSNQPLFPIQSEMVPSFGNHNFWPQGNTAQQTAPTPVPPPAPPPPPLPPLPLPLPPVPSQKSHLPPQFLSNSFHHPPVDKRMLKTSFNTSIPSLMDLPSSYNRKSVPPQMPIAPVPIKSMESTKPPMSNVPAGGNNNAKRRKIPAWLREELGRMEREKEKKLQNTSNSNLSLNNSSSKFDDDEDANEEDDDEHETFNEPTTLFKDDDEESEADDEDDDQNSAQISSTPIVTRRSRFDDDKSTDQQQQLNVSAISRRTQSPSPPSQSSTTLLEDDPIDREEQFMMKLRRTLTELLLEVTNEELALIAKETHLSCKAESSTPVIRKASGLASLIQSFSGTDSDDDDQHEEENTTVITRSPIRPETVTNHSPEKPSVKAKKKKSTKEKSSSPSHDHKSRKHQHQKHRRYSSSSSSTSSQTRSQKKKKSFSHEQYSEHNKSKKYEDRGRKH